MRVGIGYDLHKLKKGRKLLLGGVAIPHTHGLSGHSDGDVLIHAVVDALLGALGQGDIGEHFPDTDARWKGSDSRVFAKKALALLRKQKLKISNIDATLVAEAPKLLPYKPKMKKNLAKIFGVRPNLVNIKAKTNEKTGSIGQGEAMACLAIVGLNG